MYCSQVDDVIHDGVGQIGVRLRDVDWIGWRVEKLHTEGLLGELWLRDAGGELWGAHDDVGAVPEEIKSLFNQSHFEIYWTGIGYYCKCLMLLASEQY